MYAFEVIIVFLNIVLLLRGGAYVCFERKIYIGGDLYFILVMFNTTT